jgi:hypothetical protein
MKKPTKILLIGVLLVVFFAMWLPIIKTEKPVRMQITEKVDRVEKEDIEQLKRKFGNDMIFGRFQNDLISKHMPNLRFFAKKKDVVYLVDSEGKVSHYSHITEIDDKGKVIYNQEYANFLLSQNLIINTKDDVIEIASLLETIKGSFSYPNVQTIVVKNRISIFQTLENKIFGNWYYWAEQTETGWQAGLRYERGILPVSTAARPLIYIFELDNQNKIVDFFTALNKQPTKNPDES